MAKNQFFTVGLQRFKARKTLLSALAALLLAGSFITESCDTGSDGNENNPNLATQLEYSNLSRLAFMGGSLIYNPPSTDRSSDESVGGQIIKGAKIPVRLSTLTLNTGATDPNDVYTEKSREFGYIVINDVNENDVTLTYNRYDDNGNIDYKNQVIISKDDVNGDDINGDGYPDLLYQAPAYKRDGMANAMYLEFISKFDSSSSTGNTGMYSVLADNYANGALPNGVMGVNPQGQLVITTHNENGSRSAVRGAEYGDIVVDTLFSDDEHIKGSARYGYITNGVSYRGAAREVSIDDNTVQEVLFNGDWTNQQPSLSARAAADSTDSDTTDNMFDDNIYSTTEQSQPNSKDSKAGLQTNETADTGPYFAEEQFNNTATPDALLALIPDSLKSNTGDVITQLNAVLNKPLTDVINAVLSNPTTDVANNSDFKTMAKSLETDTSSSLTSGSSASVSAVRSFLTQAFPANCPAAAATSVPDMFPLMSVSFSSTDNPNVALSAAIAQAQLSFNEHSADGARAAESGYTNYVNQKKSISSQFTSQYKKIASFDILNVIAGVPSKASAIKNLKSSFDSVSFTLTLGLYGSLTSYWGKIELGVGAALLVNAEADSPRVAGYKNYNAATQSSDISISQTLYNSSIVVGPVLLNVSIQSQEGLMIDTAFKGDIFAGFIGLYGGRAWVGADYGIGWNYYKVWFVKIWYPCPYFNAYARGDKVATQAYYFGPKTTSTVPVSGNLTLTPYISITPKLTLWGSVWGEIKSIAKLPGSITITPKPFSGSLELDLDLDIDAIAGISFNFGVYKYNHSFNSWQLYTWSTPLYKGIMNF